MKTLTLLLAFSLAAFSCSDDGLDLTDEGANPLLRDFNFSLRYGVGALNEVNTFKNMYTKDLISDGTITVPFVLSKTEFDSVHAKMVQIDFFNYPETLVVPPFNVLVTPHSTFYFRVQNQPITKTLYWNDNNLSMDQRATKLRELFSLIRTIIESKPEYQLLPPSRGGYL